MTSTSSSNCHYSCMHSIWLSVERAQQAQCFELPADGERCITFGSAMSADVRIEGVAPIAFHLERDESGVRLTPAYADPCLRIDAQRVEGSRWILGQAVVELFECRLILRLCDVPPIPPVQEQTNSPVSPGDSQTRHRTTVMDPAATTTEVPCPADVPVLRQHATAIMQREQPVTSEMLPTQTIEMGVVHFEQWRSPARRVPAGATQRIEVVPMPLQPAPIVDLQPPPANPPTSEPPTLPWNAAMSKQPKTPKFEPVRQSAVFSMGSSKHASETTAVEVPVAQLGTLTRRYPIAGIGGAAVGSLMLVAFLVGAARITGFAADQNRGAAVLPSRVTTAVTAAASVKNSELKPEVSPAVSSKAHGSNANGGETKVSSPVAATADVISDANLPIAVGHLLSGRLPEAEQAYRDFATRFPEDLTVATLRRILSRRNSPDCRPGNVLKKACPTVKP